MSIRSLVVPVAPHVSLAQVATLALALVVSLALLVREMRHVWRLGR